MDDETPRMEALSQQMRQVMAAWVADPENHLLRSQYHDLQHRYQRLFLDWKRQQREAAA